MSDSTAEAEKEMEEFHDAQESSPLPVEHAQVPVNAPTTEIPAETTTQVREDVKDEVVSDAKVERSITSPETASNATTPSPVPHVDQSKAESGHSAEEKDATDGIVLSKVDAPPVTTTTTVVADIQTVAASDVPTAEPKTATKVADDSHPALPEEPRSGQTERSLAEEEILSRIEDVEDWAEEEKSPEEELTEEEEPDEKESLDDDRDRRKPQYIPRSGVYFMHDDRAGSDEHSEEEGSPEEEKGEAPVGEAPEAVVEPTEERGGRWSHDLYSENAGGAEGERRQPGFVGRGVRGVRRRGRMYGRPGMRRAAPRRVRGGRAVPLAGRMHSQDDGAAAQPESQDEPEKENQRVLEEEKKKERSAEIPAGERRLPRQPILLPYRPPRRGRGGPPPFADKSAPSTPRYQNVEDWDYDEHFEQHQRESYGRPPSRMRTRGGPRSYGAPRPRPYYQEEYEDDYYDEYERGDVGNTFHGSRVFFGRGRGPRGGRNGPPPRRAPPPPVPSRRAPPMRAEAEHSAPPVPAPPQAAYRSAPAGYPPPRTAGREPYSNRNQGRVQHSESGPSGRYGANENAGRYGAAEGGGPRAAAQPAPPPAPPSKRYSRRQTSVPEKQPPQQSGDARVAYQPDYFPPGGRGGGMAGGGGGYGYPPPNYGYNQPMEAAPYYGAPYEQYGYGGPAPPHQPMQPPMYNYQQHGYNQGY